MLRRRTIRHAYHSKPGAPGAHTKATTQSASDEEGSEEGEEDEALEEPSITNTDRSVPTGIRTKIPVPQKDEVKLVSRSPPKTTAAELSGTTKTGAGVASAIGGRPSRADKAQSESKGDIKASRAVGSNPMAARGLAVAKRSIVAEHDGGSDDETTTGRVVGRTIGGLMGGAGAAGESKPIEGKTSGKIDRDLVMPGPVRTAYTNNYNIEYLHEIMLAVFRAKRSEVPRLQRNVLTMQETANETKLQVRRKSIESEIAKLQTEITARQNDLHYRAFLKSVEPLLKRYQELHVGPPVDAPLSSGSSRAQAKTSTKSKAKTELSIDDQTERINVIQQYIHYAKQYHAVDIIRVVTMTPSCYCGIPEASLSTDGDGNRCCAACGYSRSDTSVQITEETTNPTTATSSKDRENFEHAIANYQGRSAPLRYQQIVADLDVYFAQYGLPISTSTEVERDKTGRPLRTTRKLMYDALKFTDNAHAYPKLNYILAEYWGWPREDISSHEAFLLEDYDMFQKVYEKIKTGKASFNVNYRLLRHLKRAGYPCKFGDFKIPQSEAYDRLERNWNQCHVILFNKQAPSLR